MDNNKEKTICFIKEHFEIDIELPNLNECIEEINEKCIEDIRFLLNNEIPKTKWEFKEWLVIENDLLKNVPEKFFDKNNEWYIYADSFMKQGKDFIELWLEFKKNIIDINVLLERLYSLDNYENNKKLIIKLKNRYNSKKEDIFHNFLYSNNISTYNTDNNNKRIPIMAWMFYSLLEKKHKNNVNF